MGKELTISQITSTNYDIITFCGEINIATLIPVTAKLNTLTTFAKPKDLVIDLSMISSLDSSGIRLLINLDKKIKASEKKFYLLKPSENVMKIINETNMDKVFTIIDSQEHLENEIQKNIYETYVPYVKEEDGLQKINCSCVVCGSPDVTGYLIDKNAYNWRWIEDDPFPSAYAKEGDTPVDLFSIMPIVCSECYMTSIRIPDFNILSDNNTVEIKSTVKDESKNLLAKSIKKRKKMMEIDTSVGETFFYHPRNKTVVYKAYELAEFCIRTISVLNTNASPFEVGYLNYLSIRYADSNQKETHINSCRTWFTQALQNVEELTSFERAVSYFVLLVSDLNLDKKKEAAQLYADFSRMMEELPSTVSPECINSPLFWYTQAEVIWKKEIESQSAAFKVK